MTVTLEELAEYLLENPLTVDPLETLDHCIYVYVLLFNFDV